MPNPSLLIIVLISVILFGCNENEPVVELCSVIDDVEVSCETPADPKTPPRVTTTNKLFGYTCVSANDYGKIEAHHKILHRQLDQK